MEEWNLVDGTDDEGLDTADGAVDGSGTEVVQRARIDQVPVVSLMMEPALLTSSSVRLVEEPAFVSAPPSLMSDNPSRF